MPKFSTSYARFLGGKNLVYTLALIFSLGMIILVYSHISFIFHPLVVIVETIALPLILAVIAYYLLRPIVRWFERKGIPRTASILLIFAFALGGLVLLLSFIVPFLEKQITSMAQEFPAYAEQIGASIDAWLQASIFQDVYANVSSNINGWLSDIPGTVSSYAGDTFTGIAALLIQVTNVLVAIITLPFILYYLLKDGEAFPKAVVRTLPPKIRNDARKIFSDMDHQISSYIVGQLLVSFCIGISLYIGFLIIGLDYALVLAAIASVTAVVPYLGPAIAILPALIIAMTTSFFMLAKLLIVWTVVQLLEGKFISPQIMGKRLRVHPVTVIFILLTAAHLLGVIGVILAIPSYALIKVVILHLYRLFQLRFNRFASTDNQYEISFPERETNHQKNQE
ncbi:AI-2E family transporter [Marinococcus luteus]|uniref:AI-2E family transporter n=1 Tax=Marinococcus luteus TaxID=1122204 RepID=UPI002ACC7594|nr:AI-2E family transporter [Marinococcus luteus]MDZ5781965.1 AI-2E family transporter [Marinococcus luteus]